MKHNSRLNTVRMFCAFSIAMFLSFSGFASLSGTYTIDPNKSASSSNYLTFASAVSDLVSGSRSDGGTANGSGVSGAVVFKVAAGSYNEQISIGSISGTSSTNTVTFQSANGDSSKVHLYTAASNSTDYALQLNGVSYVIFKQIKISRSGSGAYGIVVNLTGGAAYNKFIGNLLVGVLQISTTTSGIVAGESTVNFNGTNNYNEFIGNRIKYGYNGICFSAGSTTGSTGTKIYGNIIDTAAMSGVYGHYAIDFVMDSNTVNMGEISLSGTHYLSYGVRLEYCQNFRITKNRFYNTSKASVSRCVVIFFTPTASSSTTHSLIANNFLWVSAGSTSSTGITLGGNNDVDMFFNNVLMTAVSSTPSAALYMYPQYAGSGNVAYNNNFVNMGNGYAIENSSTANNTGLTSDYNNLYTKGSYIGNYQGTNYSTLSGWQSGTSGDAKSVSTDPGYVSNYDLHVSSSKLNNTGKVVSVTDDIDAQTRSSSTPDIGADEFSPFTNDAGVTSLDSPMVYCSGTKNIIVRFTNFGIDTVKKITINWSVDGSAKTAYNWTGKLAIGEISSQITLGSLSLTSNTPYVIKVWTSQPNGSSDQKSTNDTLVKTLNSGMTGSYTIGSSGNYATFNDALDAVALRGLCGAVVFKVKAGTYGEQISVPNFTTSSATNTITFESEDKDSTKVILSYGAANANGVNNMAVQLNGARYVTFKQITIERSGTGIYEGVIEIKGGSHNNRFINNRIVGTSRTSASVNSDLVSSTADKDTGNIFRNNYFKNGSTGISITSNASQLHENGYVIEENTFDGTYANAINATYSDGIIIRKNKFLNIVTGGASSASGVQISSSDKAVTISANEIIMQKGGKAGIYINGNAATSGAPAVIVNNYVSMGTGTGTSTPNGIMLENSSYYNIFFNTVHLYNTNTGSALYTNSTTNITLRDNIFNNIGGGYAINSVSSSSISASTYNNLFSSGTNVARNGTTNYVSLISWRTATGLDGNSISFNPQFFTNTSYSLNNPNLYRQGVAITGYTTDIIGRKRNNPPSMGAFEFKLAANDAGVAGFVSPAINFCPGTTDVVISVKNSGSDTLRTFDVEWTINNTPRTTYSFKGNIAPDSSQNVTIGSFGFGESTYRLKATVKNPNNAADSFSNNDVLEVSVTAKNATAVAGNDTAICVGEMLEIGADAVTGETYSWTANNSGYTSSDAKPTVAPLVTTTYKLVVKNASGCMGEDSVTVTVNTKPVANAGSDQSICVGDSVKIGSAGNTGEVYSWTNTASTSGNPYVKPNKTTTYKLTVKNASGCMDEDSVMVVVDPLPVANAGKDTAICEGSSIQIGKAAVTGETYSWVSDPAGFTSTSANPTISPSATATYKLVVKNASGCVSSDEITVTVNPYITVDAGTDRSICIGQSFKIGRPAVTGETYSWTSDPAGFTSTDANPTVTPSVTTTYKLKVTNNTGCTGEDEIKITVNPLPVADAGPAKEICTGGSVQIGTAPVTGHTYAWTSVPSGFTSTSANPTVSPAATTKYNLTITNASGCTATSSVIVTVNVPTASFNVTGTGLKVTFTAKNQTYQTYDWNFRDGTIDTGRVVEHTFPTAGTYLVKLKVVDKIGCTTTQDSNVTVTGVGINDMNAPVSEIKIYPNPFNTSTVLNYDLAKAAKVHIGLMDITGKQIALLEDNLKPSGTHTLVIKAADHDLKAGIYFVNIKVNDAIISRKIVRVE